MGSLVERIATVMSTIGAVPGGAGTAAAAAIGINEHFIRDVEAIMKPGTSVLFVLDHECRRSG